MGLATPNFFFGPAPWGPREGSKGQILFNFNYKVNFKDFFYQTLCVFSQMKIQNISDGIFSLFPGSCPRGGTLGCWGAQGVNFFFKHGHVVYQIDGMTSRTMQVKFSSWGQTIDLGVRSKVKYH